MTSFSALAALLLSVSLTACATVSTNDVPQIVVTTNILGDVVEEIAGDEAHVTTLMKPNADPHSFEISAQEAALLSSADLIVSNGLGLEEGLQQHLDRAAAQDVKQFVAGEHISVLNYRSADAAGTPDPHFWTDPARMLDVVNGLEAALSEIVGVDAAAIRSNAERYRNEVQQLDTQMQQSFDSIPRERRSLVTNHHVFGYLAERFGFTIVGAVIPGGTTLASPSAADLRELSIAIEQAGVPTIFAEASQSDRLVQVLASEAGVHVSVVELFTESLTEPGEGADSYLTMMRANTERITNGLNS
ncbi:zinc ABC transporter substrate-binding protein AztC [Leucobacter sp. UT-8R-CII-1-4]|uniref:zinc ABC transporter substrate-binding protein AztC n=1 Tax=Leucobacter sp. UT-8R-CII-1-4 TaxID=3040075 RepID=UPI0024A949F4|nr:zinc ABC transporter substrate-binding protein AztC [Leucobacter sp. UT-8R-CII-1-4]MDI6022609.1 zinc ABC transporter substrate-binding protein AztC [Leucobacter sp. UT-8R-CII-1-4]